MIGVISVLLQYFQKGRLQMKSIKKALSLFVLLTMLTSLFYGEVSEKVEKPPKEKRKRGKKRTTVVKEHTA